MLSNEKRKSCTETDCFIKMFSCVVPEISEMSISDAMHWIGDRMRSELDHRFSSSAATHDDPGTLFRFCGVVYELANEAFLNPFLAPFGVGEEIKRYCIIMDEFSGVNKKKRRSINKIIEEERALSLF